MEVYYYILTYIFSFVAISGLEVIAVDKSDVEVFCLLYCFSSFFWTFLSLKPKYFSMHSLYAPNKKRQYFSMIISWFDLFWNSKGRDEKVRDFLFVWRVILSISLFSDLGRVLLHLAWITDPNKITITKKFCTKFNLILSVVEKKLTIESEHLSSYILDTCLWLGP